MALYEHIFMVRQDVSNAQVDTLTEQFKSILDENGAKIVKTEYWGVRPLNYRIRKNRKAHFTLLNIDGPSAAVAEMERQMRINDDVIRHLTIRVDEHEEGPSAMMRSSRGGRDDRGPRGPRRDDDRGPRGPRRDDDNRGDNRGGDKGPAKVEAKADEGASAKADDKEAK